MNANHVVERIRGSVPTRPSTIRKSSDALLLRCSDAEGGQDCASGVDRPSTTVVLCNCSPRPGGAIIFGSLAWAGLSSAFASTGSEEFDMRNMRGNCKTSF